jgi:hypothetical protein
MAPRDGKTCYALAGGFPMKHLDYLGPMLLCLGPLICVWSIAAVNRASGDVIVAYGGIAGCITGAGLLIAGAVLLAAQRAAAKD